ncbi:uncharacterized protein CTRU02_206115 [Colletotrichum truncatum]|uniref:Uncharacterized protein n=1 Tax=Colletotrichum truncatum TaxID=5467 RepID=A0ACC3Z611_COLTU|nr:uncharacterized protein CTRU02_10471 [Colletotrichum truncatum]KAF6787208.1 hypothetical protein CTRU02_10471 [Colletotrichum truncatum]
MNTTRHCRVDFHSKENEWAIIDEEEEEELERMRQRRQQKNARYLVAGLIVVLVPAICGVVWWFW